MKKLLTLVLSAVMLLTVAVSAVPVSASGDAFQIGEDTYSTLSAAWTAATTALGTADSVTIKVVDDYTVSGSDKGFALAAGKTVYLEGIQKTDESYPTLSEKNGAAGGIVFSGIKGNLELKNLNVIASQFAEAQGNAVVTFDNVKAEIPAGSETTGGTSGGPLVKMWGVSDAQDNVTVNILNSEIESRSTLRPWIIASGSKNEKATVNVTNSSLSAKGNVTNTDAGIFTVYSASCAMDINLENSTVSDETSTAATYCVYARNASSKINLTADSTSKLQIGAAAAGQASNSFLGGSGTLTTEFSGGTSFSALSGVESFTLPTLKNTDTVSWLGFSKQDSTSIYKNGATVPAGVYRCIGYSKNDFTIVNGAAIRTADPAMGLRFTAKVSESFKTILGDGATFGMLIAPKEKIMAVNLFKMETMAEQNYINVSYAQLGQADDGVITYYGAVIGEGDVTYDMVNTKFAARAYVSFTFEGDTAATVFYTDFSFENNERSMYDVAKLVKESSGYTTNNTVEAIYSAGQPSA